MTDYTAEKGPETLKVPSRKAWAAVVVGVLLIAAAAGHFYGIDYLRHKIIRANSWAGFAAVMAKGDEQRRIVTAIGVSEATLLVWSCIAWAAAGLIGLSGLWSAVQRRFGWKLLRVAGVVTILAAVLTVAAGQVLERYANFQPFGTTTYAMGFAAHSLPGWLILVGLWIGRRRGKTMPSTATDSARVGPEESGTSESPQA